MDIAIFAPIANPWSTAEYVKTLGREIEARGFESIWVPEHVVLFDEYDSQYPYSADGQFPSVPGSGLLEPFTALTFLAAVTETVRLGTGICLLPQRNPVYTARQAADLDWLSGGRVELGVGVGWLREEFDALQVPFERRGARTDEYLELVKTLWTEDVPSHQGEFWNLPACRLDPKPVQQPHPPIHVGGESDAALRRAARHGDGWFGFNRTPDEVPEALERLAEVAAAEGRSGDGLTITICSYFHGLTPDMVKGYADAGVDRVIGLLIAPDTPSIAPALDALVPCLEAAR